MWGLIALVAAVIIVIIIAVVMSKKKTSEAVDDVTATVAANTNTDSSALFTLLSNTACRDQNGNFTSLMYAQNPPAYSDTLSNCQTDCASKAFCVGIDFFPQGLPGYGQCSLLSDKPYASTMNKDREFCYSKNIYLSQFQ